MKIVKTLDLTPRPGADESQPRKPTKMLFFDRWRALRAGLRSGFGLVQPEHANKNIKKIMKNHEKS